MHHLGLREQLSEVTAQQAGAVPKEGNTELSKSTSLRGRTLELNDSYAEPAFVTHKADQPSEGYTFARMTAPCEHLSTFRS